MRFVKHARVRWHRGDEEQIHDEGRCGKHPFVFSVLSIGIRHKYHIRRYTELKKEKRDQAENAQHSQHHGTIGTNDRVAGELNDGADAGRGRAALVIIHRVRTQIRHDKVVNETATIHTRSHTITHAYMQTRAPTLHNHTPTRTHMHTHELKHLH
jgi:hypothetical protein